MLFTLQQCLFCGAFHQQTTGFCKSCIRFFSDSAKLFQPCSPFSNHHYVLNWMKDKTPPIDLLIKELKANPSSQIFQYWGKQMANLCLKLTLNNPCLVPAAAKKSMAEDHALALTKQLSHYLGLPIHNVLTREENKQAKKLSKRERAESISFYCENFSHNGDVIFVDDVLTTGTTAIQSIKALNTKKKVHIVTLAYRLFL